ncbi:hypothetical protein HZB96_04695 [Candidatus Gottesmanbacteria bacterium]|nr:hypothetical protein [Candidatus Gottesmanbacteria bacterium]MBI5452198.1 hypothetical protein [Candidatus Gottesmanbacteria bacterium]
MRLLVLLALWTTATSSVLIGSFVGLSMYKKDNLELNMNSVVEAKSVNFYITPSPYLPINISPQQDIRIITLQKFFQIYKSPLSDHIEDIVKQADLNGMDYALLPAIAMQESGGCKNIPVDSFNCWGFGIYGSKVTKFSSFPEAIAQVTKTVKEAYIKNGLTNATLVEDRWTPSSRGNWSYAVNFFISKIRDIEKNIPAS